MSSQEARAFKALGIIHRYAQRTGEAWLGQKTISRIMATDAGRKPAKYGDRQIRRYQGILVGQGLMESSQNASRWHTNLYRLTPAGELLLKVGGATRPELAKRPRTRGGAVPHRPTRNPPAAPTGAFSGGPMGEPDVRPDAPKDVRQAFPQLEPKTSPPTPPAGGRGHQELASTQRVPSTEAEM